MWNFNNRPTVLSPACLYITGSILKEAIWPNDKLCMYCKITNVRVFKTKL